MKKTQLLSNKYTKNVNVYMYNIKDSLTSRHKQPNLCRLVRSSFDECPGYDIKHSGEAPVILWPGVVAPDRVLSMGQIEVFDI